MMSHGKDDKDKDKVNVVVTYGRVNYVIENDKLPLLFLPSSIIQLLTNFISTTDKKRLAETNKHLFSLFGQNMRLANLFIRKCLSHVLNGEHQETEAMIKRDTGLLIETASVMDHSKRCLFERKTVLQIALSYHDVNLETKCQLLRINQLHSQALPINAKMTYVRFDDCLVYVDKNALYHTILEDKKALTQFDIEFQPTIYVKILSATLLLRITQLTGHIHQNGLSQMILSYLKQLPNGKQRIAAQIQAQFPPGWEQLEQEKAAQDLQILQRIGIAIEKLKSKFEFDPLADTNIPINSYFGLPCANVIMEFEEYLDLRANTKTGLAFNYHQLHRQACAVYESFNEKYNWHGSIKSQIFKNRVIGTVERWIQTNTLVANAQPAKMCL